MILPNGDKKTSVIVSDFSLKSTGENEDEKQKNSAKFSRRERAGFCLGK